MAKVITVGNPFKGGTGKTSFVLGIGSALNRLKKTVLLVDMDGTAALTFGLIGDEAGDLEYSIYDVLTKGKQAKEILIEVGEGITLLPSSLALDNLETDEIEKKSFLLRDVLRGPDRQFDFILIDTPPRLGSLTLNALVAAQGVYAVIQADVLSYRSLISLKDIISETSSRYNKGLKLEGIIINFYDRRRNLERFIREKILREYKGICFRTAIRRAVAVPESIMAGKDIFHYASWSSVAKDFMDLAREILRKNEVRG